MSTEPLALSSEGAGGLEMPEQRLPVPSKLPQLRPSTSLPSPMSILSQRGWMKRQSLKIRKGAPSLPSFHFLPPVQAPAPKTSGGGECEWRACSHRQLLDSPGLGGGGGGRFCSSGRKAAGKHTTDAGNLSIAVIPYGAQWIPLIQP